MARTSVFRAVYIDDIAVAFLAFLTPCLLLLASLLIPTLILAVIVKETMVGMGVRAIFGSVEWHAARNRGGGALPFDVVIHPAATALVVAHRSVVCL